MSKAGQGISEGEVSFDNMFGLFAYAATEVDENGNFVADPEDENIPRLMSSEEFNTVVASSFPEAVEKIAGKLGCRVLEVDELESQPYGRDAEINGEGKHYLVRLWHLLGYRPDSGEVYVVAVDVDNEGEGEVDYVFDLAGPTMDHVEDVLRYYWGVEPPEDPEYREEREPSAESGGYWGWNFELSEKNEDGSTGVKPVYVRKLDATVFEGLSSSPPAAPRPDAARRVWLFTPGKGAVDREPALRLGYMVMGWSDVGDLRVLESDDQLLVCLQAFFGGENGTSYRTRGQARSAITQLRTLQRDVSNGDIVVMREGKNRVLAVGVVTGTYRYDSRWRGANDFSLRWGHAHRVPVRWVRIYEHGLPIDLNRAEHILGRGNTETLVECPLNSLHDLFPNEEAYRDALEACEQSHRQDVQTSLQAGSILEDESRSTPETIESSDNDRSSSEPVSSGQGYENDAERRKMIELYAMEKATAWYRDHGFSVRDVSLWESYDLLCTKEAMEVRVEVKGTTSDGSSVNVTKNEVENARLRGVRTDLFVVSAIGIINRNGEPAASGGNMHIVQGWCPSDADLTPTAYKCFVPPERRV